MTKPSILDLLELFERDFSIIDQLKRRLGEVAEDTRPEASNRAHEPAAPPLDVPLRDRRGG